MIVSEARMAANRRNAHAVHRTEDRGGQGASRANALKHGLCASVVVAEDAELVQQRASDWFDALKPQNEFQSWLVDEVAMLSLRIDRCERMERRVRDVKAIGPSCAGRTTGGSRRSGSAGCSRSARRRWSRSCGGRPRAASG